MGGTGLSLKHGKVDGCSPGGEAGWDCGVMDAPLGLARVWGLHALLARACQAEMYVVREKAPGNNKGAGGTGTGYRTCRTQGKTENVGSLFKGDDEFQGSDSRA